MTSVSRWILTFAIVCSFSVRLLAESWAISYVNRATGVRETSRGFATKNAAESWGRFIQVPLLQNGDSGPQFVDFRVYKESDEESQNDGAVLPRFVDLIMDGVETIGTAKDIVDENYESLRDRMFPSAGLQGYADGAAMAYENAKIAKERLPGLVGSALEGAFANVNAAVDKYNRTRDDAARAPGGDAFNRLPRMTPVGTKLAKALPEWKELQKGASSLRDENSELNTEYQNLKSEREGLIEDANDIRNLEYQVKSLRSAASGGGPFQVRLNGDIVIPGEYDFIRRPMRTFSTFEEVTAWLNRVGPYTLERATVTDSSGNRVTKPPQAPDTTRLQQLESELNSKKLKRQERVTEYRRRKSAYDSKAIEYEKKVAKRKTNAEKLREFAYRPRKFTGRPRTEPPNALQQTRRN